VPQRRPPCHRPRLCEVGAEPTTTPRNPNTNTESRMPNAAFRFSVCQFVFTQPPASPPQPHPQSVSH
jgi:hypothetical protein